VERDRRAADTASQAAIGAAGSDRAVRDPGSADERELLDTERVIRDVERVHARDGGRQVGEEKLIGRAGRRKARQVRGRLPARSRLAGADGAEPKRARSATDIELAVENFDCAQIRESGADRAAGRARTLSHELNATGGAGHPEMRSIDAGRAADIVAAE